MKHKKPDKFKLKWLDWILTSGYVLAYKVMARNFSGNYGVEMIIRNLIF